MSITDAPRCQAKKTNGEPCKAAAMRGQKVCRVHGGSSKKAKGAAILRLAYDSAMAQANKFLEEDDSISDPHEVLLKRLRHAGKMVFLYATMLQPLYDEGDRLVEEKRIDYRGFVDAEWVSFGEAGGYMKYTTDPLIVASNSGFKDHPWVLKLEYWCEKHAYFAKLCIDAKVDERRLQIAENTVQEFIRLMEASFDRLGLSAEQRQAERQAIARDTLRLVG